MCRARGELAGGEAVDTLELGVDAQLVELRDLIAGRDDLDLRADHALGVIEALGCERFELTRIADRHLVGVEIAGAGGGAVGEHERDRGRA